MKKETKECIRIFGIALAVMIAVPLAYRVCISIWPPKEKPHRSLDQFFREAEIAHSLELLATPVAKWSDADAKAEPVYEQMDLFSDSAEEEQKREQEKARLEKEKKRQQALLAIKKKYGKNAILPGTSYQEGATGRERNRQIGGHKA